MVSGRLVRCTAICYITSWVLWLDLAQLNLIFTAIWIFFNDKIETAPNPAIFVHPLPRQTQKCEANWKKSRGKWSTSSTSMREGILVHMNSAKNYVSTNNLDRLNNNNVMDVCYKAIFETAHRPGSFLLSCYPDKPRRWLPSSRIQSMCLHCVRW